MTEFISVVGPPSSKSAVGKKLILQWQATGYHIVILFDPNTERFLSITHESGNYEPEPNYVLTAVIIAVVLIVIAMLVILNNR